MTRKERKERNNWLAVKAFVFFSFNYPNYKEIIRYVCEQTGEGKVMQRHLEGKFVELYDLYGADAVMNRFFVELNEKMRQALVKYAVTQYFPHAFLSLASDDACEIGIDNDIESETQSLLERVFPGQVVYPLEFTAQYVTENDTPYDIIHKYKTIMLKES